MKKIKLDTGKLKLKKESIGNLLNKEIMKQIVGGYGGTTGYGGCMDYTQNGVGACQSQNCSPFQTMGGCGTGGGGGGESGHLSCEFTCPMTCPGHNGCYA